MCSSHVYHIALFCNVRACLLLIKILEIPYLRAIRLGLNNNILVYEKVCYIFQKDLTFFVKSRSYGNTRVVYDKL
jgi:hypothetical protein